MQPSRRSQSVELIADLASIWTAVGGDDGAFTVAVHSPLGQVAATGGRGFYTLMWHSSKSASPAAETTTSTNSGSGSSSQRSDDTVGGISHVDELSGDLNPVTAGLRLAAEAAVTARLDLEDFMRAAWTAYVDSRPGFRDLLADTQLVQQIQELRSQGRVGQA